MGNGKEKDELLRRYVLGWLQAEEQLRLEKQLLTDDELFEELQIAEDDVIDSYLCGSLSEAERERFERIFLAAAERQQKTRFGQALRKYIAEQSPAPAMVDGDQPTPPWWKRFLSPSSYNQNPLRGAMAAFALLIIAIGAGLLVKNILLREPVPQTPQTASVVALSPGTTRDGGEIKRVIIPADTAILEAQLELTTDKHATYQALVQTAEGIEVFKASVLQAEKMATAKVIILRLPVRLLSSGDYRIQLSGVAEDGGLEDVGRYSLRITIAAS